MKRALVAVVIVSVALGGCNWIKGLGKKDNVEPPTALTEFAPSVSVETVWTASIGKGAGKSGARDPGAQPGDLEARRRPGLSRSGRPRCRASASSTST